MTNPTLPDSLKIPAAMQDPNQLLRMAHDRKGREKMNEFVDLMERFISIQSKNISTAAKAIHLTRVALGEINDN